MLDETIAEIARRGIQTIPNCTLEIKDGERLRDSLLNVTNSGSYINSTQAAEYAFHRLTQGESSGSSLNTFLNGWKTTHVTALYVSGLMIRIQREAQDAFAKDDYAKGCLLSKAAYHIGEIIAEDTGVIGVQHGELYERFAKSISKGDNWKLDKHKVPECDEFRRYVEKGRLRRPVEEAILMTAASENWNTGEYTFAAPLITEWLIEKRGMPEKDAKAAAAYVSVHAGDTELDHFTHALKAWQLYQEAHGREAQPEKAASAFEGYAQKAGVAYGALRDVLPKPQTGWSFHEAAAKALPSARAIVPFARTN